MRSNSDKNGLTDRQRRAIPYFIAGGSIEGNCKRARLSKGTFFNWAKSEPFKTALKKARDEATAEALESLKAGVGEAVRGILELAQDEDKWLRLRACERILEAFWRAKELGELEERIKAIEDRLK